MLRGREGVDDDQPSAATRARQREDAGRRIVIVEAVAIGATLLWHLGPEQVPDPGDICSAVAVSEEAVVADAVEPCYALQRIKRFELSRVLRPRR